LRNAGEYGFEDYEKEAELLQDAGDVITEYVKTTLEEMARVVVRGQDKGKINSIWLLERISAGHIYRFEGGAHSCP